MLSRNRSPRSRRDRTSRANHRHHEEPSATFINPDDHIGLRDEIWKYLVDKYLPAASLDPLAQHADADHLYNCLNFKSNFRDEHTESVLQGIKERRRHRADRRYAERAWAESVPHFRSFVEQLPGIPYIASINVNTGHIYVGSRITEVLGFSPAQWCNEPGLHVRQLHADDKARVLMEIRNAVAQKDKYRIEYRIAHRDGSLRWIHDEGHVVTNDAGDPLFLQGAMLDITERKRAQEELEKSHNELHELISMLDTLRIEEQRRLAHELHDDFGQLLATMKIDLCTLQRHLPQHNVVALKCLASINDLVDSMVTSVRRILADLPPRIVEDLGLAEALETIADNFQSRHQVQCRVRISGRTEMLNIRLASTIYRIVQEALNNVTKHANATAVDIDLECTDSGLSLRIEDNGNGMQPGSMYKSGSFGIIGMRERIAALSGTMNIDAQCKKGTIISINIPLPASIAPSKTW